MHVALDMGFEVIDDLVGIFVIHAPVVGVLVGENLRAVLYVSENDGLHRVLFSIGDDGSAYGLAALQHSHDNRPAADISAFLLHTDFSFFVHVPCLAADEGFIYLNLPAETS